MLKKSIKSINKFVFIMLIIIIILIIIFFIILGIYFYKYLPNINLNLFAQKEISKEKTEENIINSLNNQTEIKNCTKKWDCTEWSKCYDQTKKRDCKDINNCGTDKDKPSLVETCCLWQCEEWSECYHENIQTRKCTINEQECESLKPETIRNCTYKNPCKDTENQTDYYTPGNVTDSKRIKWEDYCKGDYIIEKSCSNTGLVLNQEYLCPYGCQNGSCITTISCINNDYYCPSNCTYETDNDCKNG